MKTLEEFLNGKVKRYNHRGFIEGDPVSIPHRFSRKEDIEISGFLTALISWGRRDIIVRSASDLMDRMEYQPYDFVMYAGSFELKRISGFYYRTFHADDLLFILEALRNIYQKKIGLEGLAATGFQNQKMVRDAIVSLREGLLKYPHLSRSEKHLANPATGSAAKRINMFLRWMVRKDDKGVDFGLWKSIPSSALMCPLDIHSGRVARKLGLLTRKQNDWKAVEELTANLRTFDPEDPVRYDYALFGMGVMEG
ncbi:MAG: TIGR02757 family protein [bacterium]